MIASTSQFRSGYPVGFGLLFITVCMLAARTSVATEEHVNNATVPLKNLTIDEINKAVTEPDFEGENALLEVLGDEDIDQNQVEFPCHSRPFNDSDPLTFKYSLAERGF